MTHQAGAVQSAARKNILHFFIPQPTGSIWGIDVLVLLSSGHCVYYRTYHIGLCLPLVVKKHITLFYFRAPICVEAERGRVFQLTHFT